MGGFYTKKLFQILEKEHGYTEGITVLGATEDVDGPLSLLGEISKYQDYSMAKIKESVSWTRGYDTWGFASTVTTFAQVFQDHTTNRHNDLNLVVEKHPKGYLLCFWLKKGCRSHDQHRRFNTIFSRAERTLEENSADNYHEVPMVDNGVTIRGDLVVRLGPVHYQIILGFESDNFEQLETSRCLLARYVDSVNIAS